MVGYCVFFFVLSFCFQFVCACVYYIQGRPIVAEYFCGKKTLLYVFIVFETEIEERERGKIFQYEIMSEASMRTELIE